MRKGPTQQPRAWSVQVEKGRGVVRTRFGRIATTVCLPPDLHDENPGAKPQAGLKLDWAHGYNGNAVGSLHWVSDNDFVFPHAGLGVVQRLQPREQGFFQNHSNQVTCMAYHEGSGLCASGQMDPRGAGRPFVAVWRAADCILQSVLIFHERQILAVGFHPAGHLLFTLGRDDMHTLAAWQDFAPKRLISARQQEAAGQLSPSVLREPRCTATNGKIPAFAVAMPGAGGPESPVQFVLYDAGFGEKGFLTLKFWSCVRGGQDGLQLKGKAAVFGSAPTPRRAMFCSCLSQERWLVCGDNGLFYIFQGSQVVQHHRVCSGPLGCGAEFPDGSGCLVFASHDGALYFGTPKSSQAAGGGRPAKGAGRRPESAAAKEGQGWLVPVPLPEMGGALVAASAKLQFCTIAVRRCTAPSQRSLALLGTRDRHVLLIDLGLRRLLEVLQVGHAGETWALCHHPDKSLQLFATGSSDAAVRFWDSRGRAPVVGRLLNLSSRPGAPATWWPAGTGALDKARSVCPRGVFALAFGSSGDLLAVGHGEGTLRIFSFPELQPLFEDCISSARERVSDVKWSTAGTVLAVGCWDQQAYVFRLDSQGGLQLQATLKGNTSSVMHVQFGASGTVLLTNSNDGQALLFDATTGQRLTVASMHRDTVWEAPWTCPCGWQTIGVWAANKDLDITEIKCCCTNYGTGDTALLACGDDHARVQLFRYPAAAELPGRRSYAGHGSHLTAMRFTPDGRTLVSAGGLDGAILQWAVQGLKEGDEQAEATREPWVDPQPYRLGDRDRDDRPDPRVPFVEDTGRRLPARAVEERSQPPWALTAQEPPPSSQPPRRPAPHQVQPPWATHAAAPQPAGALPPRSTLQASMAGGADGPRPATAPLRRPSSAHFQRRASAGGMSGTAR